MRLYDILLPALRSSNISVRPYEKCPTVEDLEISVPIDADNLYQYWQDNYLDNGAEFFDEPLPVAPAFSSAWIEYGSGEELAGAMIQARGGDEMVIHHFRKEGEYGVKWHGGSSAYIDESGMIRRKEDGTGHTLFHGLSYDGDRDFAKRNADMALMSLAFMHFRNVSLEDAPTPISRQRARFLARRGVNRVIFKTLVIDPMKSILKSEGGVERNGIHRAMHICRGHFVTYTPDKPRFGRAGEHGTFWINAHVRGSADNGTVYKDYKVKPPK